MKTYLLYGAASAIAGFLLTLVFYLLGFHDTAAKAQSVNWLANLLLIAINVVVLVMGIKARRAQVPPHEDFGYGRALGAGVLITLFAALFGIVSSVLYFGVINPDFSRVMADGQIAQMEGKGMPAAQLEAAEKGIRFMMRTPVFAAFGFIASLFFGTVLSLIIAAFTKRAATTPVPPPPL